jgi:hypothetical protein
MAAFSVDANISRRVQRSPRGMVFTAADFAALGSQEAVKKALHRLATRGKLRHLARGLYDKPREDDLIGPLWPTSDAVLKALARQQRIRLQPTGVYAANLLGLSEQVPAKIEVLTDGASRTLRIGPMEIRLRRTSPRGMAAANQTAGMLIQALKSLGPKHITKQRIAHLRKVIPQDERRKLIRRLSLAPAWMRPFLMEIAADPHQAGKRVAR